MTTIYLINNSLTMNLPFSEQESLENRRSKRILSIEGEKESENLSKKPILRNVDIIYSSPYVMCLGTAKYLAKELELDININSLLSERSIGVLGNNKINMLLVMQENNFDFKLPHGESFNEVRLRMKKIIREILFQNRNKNIAVFTHNVIITSFLSEYCDKGFNFDDRLILNYNDNSIIDGTWNGIDIIKLEYEDEKLVNIVRLK